MFAHVLVLLLAGSIIVSTPQNVAIIDTRKGVAMFRKLGIPVRVLVPAFGRHSLGRR